MSSSGIDYKLIKILQIWCFQILCIVYKVFHNFFVTACRTYQIGKKRYTFNVLGCINIFLYLITVFCKFFRQFWGPQCSWTFSWFVFSNLSIVCESLIDETHLAYKKDNPCYFYGFSCDVCILSFLLNHSLVQFQFLTYLCIVLLQIYDIQWFFN